MESGPSGQDVVKLAKKLKQAENPFDSDKVLRARDFVVDVSEIHQAEFKRLKGELEKVRSSCRSRGILVQGVAGSGKSHLLARLYSEREKDVLFFQVQALPGGTGWLKHILQCIVNDLGQHIRHDDQEQQLSVLFKHFIDGVRREMGETNKSGYSLAILNKALEARKREIQQTIPDPSISDVFTVLVNLWKWGFQLRRTQKSQQIQRKIDLAVQWLKAAMIDEDDLAEIGVRDNLGADEETGRAGYLNVLRLFGHLTAGQAPIILYFDQLDTMEAETVNSLGDQLLQLIGSDAAAPNYLVVTAGVREEISKLRGEGIIKQAVSDVIFKTELDLPALTMSQCLKIVEKRLEPVLLPGERRELPDPADALFPFTSEFLERKLKGPVKPSPRRVLKIAESVFDEIMGEIAPEWLVAWPNVLPLIVDEPVKGPPPSLRINQFLQEELDKKIVTRAAQPLIGPVDGDLLAETICRLVKTSGEGIQLQVANLPKGACKQPTNSFFALAGPVLGPGIVGIMVNNRNHGGNMKACLNKSKQFLNSVDDAHCLVLGRDVQSSVIDKWPSCVEPLQELSATGRFARIRFEASEIATLLALDDLRKEVRDLVIPASKAHDHYQVGQEDFSKFLVETGRLPGLPFFQEVRALISKQKESEQPPPPPSDAENFVRARVEAKCIIAFNEVVIEWANHNGRVDPLKGDQKEIEQAAGALCARSLIVSLGDGAKRILKKL